MKKILFAASECVPFVKTGGLADVVGSLPKYLDHDEYDVRVILPKYTCIPEKYKQKMEYMLHFYMDYRLANRYVGVLRLKQDHVTFYFIDNEEYFSGSGPYTDMLFDIGKFSFFSKAVMSSLPLLDFRPDIIHCHDWQTGLIPVYIHDKFQGNPFFWNMKSVMTIHNLKFQGVWDVKTIQNFTELSNYYFTPDKLEAYKDANLLKGGLVYADKLSTVSPTYSEEIKDPYFGEGLDGLLRARADDLIGILNGLDYDVYNPLIDKSIFKNYDVTTFRKEKWKNKLELQKQFGLVVDRKKFMIAMISRLTDQKGFDLVACVLDEICADEEIQIVVLGTGESKYEDMFRHYDWKYPNLKANICYSEELSHQIYASSDAFLMPSLFEPCGLSQLMALRYGSVPIVREISGLRDTVEPFNCYNHTGTGFSFANYNAHEMLRIIRYAKETYSEKKREWNKIAERGMNKDFSWNKSAKIYQDIYDSLYEE